MTKDDLTPERVHNSDALNKCPKVTWISDMHGVIGRLNRSYFMEFIMFKNGVNR